MGATTSDILLYVIAVFIPPIPVVVKRGCGGHLCLNIVLWFLIWIPAVIHAFYIIASTPDVEQYEAVNIPSHYQNHPPAGGYQQQGGHHQQSFQGNGPPPPPQQHQGHGREDWDTPMQGQQQQQQANAYAPHPQQQQLYGQEQSGYGQNPPPPNYHKS